MKFSKFVLFCITFSPVVVNAAGASNEWSDGYNFRSAQDRQVILLQADLIERMENDYYKNIGRTTINNTLNSISSTTIGAINNVENNVDIVGDGNSVSNDTVASSDGDQNGSVLIDSLNTSVSTSNSNSSNTNTSVTNNPSLQ